MHNTGKIVPVFTALGTLVMAAGAMTAATAFAEICPCCPGKEVPAPPADQINGIFTIIEQETDPQTGECIKCCTCQNQCDICYVGSHPSCFIGEDDQRITCNVSDATAYGLATAYYQRLWGWLQTQFPDIHNAAAFYSRNITVHLSAFTDPATIQLIETASLDVASSNGITSLYNEWW